MDNPFDLLEQDHRDVERLLDRLAESEEGDERQDMLAELAMALQLHMQYEEDAIFPLVGSDIDDETAEEANIEHGLAREGLAKMQELVAAPGFGAAVEMDKGGIGRHVEEEESAIFPQLRKDVLRLRVPVKEQAKPRRVDVVVGRGEATSIEATASDTTTPEPIASPQGRARRDALEWGGSVGHEPGTPRCDGV